MGTQIGDELSRPNRVYLIMIKSSAWTLALPRRRVNNSLTRLPAPNSDVSCYHSTRTRSDI